jgi:CubicO group peptidase (beta-lactamase class C family)
VALSAGRTEIATARVDELFTRWNRDDSPGCALGVVSNGELLLERYYGMADLEHAVAHSPDSVFDIASSSKQFTAAAILLLSDRGEVGLDDPIQSYLPEIREYEAPVTVRHLIHHTSGIRDYLGLRHLAGINDTDYYDMQFALDLIARQLGLNFPPGTKHMYSNSGYVLLAIIVSRVTGQSFGEFCRENIFEPLGMTRSRFREDVTRIIPGLVQNYSRDKQGDLKKSIANDDIVGDGGLHTTLGDLALWERNFVEEKVGGPGFTERMATPGTPDDDPERYGFGLTSGEYRGLKIVSHGGNLTGYSGEFLRFPEQRLTVICLANMGGFDAGELARKVAEIYLEQHMEPAPAALEGAADAATSDGRVDDLDRFVHLYRMADTGLVIDVVREGEALIIKLGDQSIPLHPRGGARFGGDYQEMTLDVAFTEVDGGLLQFGVIYHGESLMEAVEIEPPPAGALDLDSFTGQYFSDELDAAARATVEEGSLYLRIGQRRELLRPTLTDEFATSFGGIHFNRGADGGVAGFTASMSRATGVAFRKLS